MKSKKNICISIIIVILISLIIIIINNQKMHTYNKDEYDKNISDSDEKITGFERVEAEEKSLDVTKKMLNAIPNLKTYAKENNIKTISFLELKEKFNLNTTEFEKMEYNCNLKKTTLNFLDDYSDYYIIFNCDRLRRD